MEYYIGEFDGYVSPSVIKANGSILSSRYLGSHFNYLFVSLGFFGRSLSVIGLTSCKINRIGLRAIRIFIDHFKNTN
jgi:hypothetical protein